MASPPRALSFDTNHLSSILYLLTTEMHNVTARLLPLKFFSIVFFICWILPSHAQVCISDIYTKAYDLGPPKGQFLLVLPGGGTIFGGQDFYNSTQVGFVKTNPFGNVVFNKRIEGLENANWSVACFT